jgi:hypothetical protein
MCTLSAGNSASRARTSPRMIVITTKSLQEPAGERSRHGLARRDYGIAAGGAHVVRSPTLHAAVIR